jgi:TolB protein
MMTDLTARVVRWCLAGGAFLAVLTVVGCAEQASGPSTSSARFTPPGSGAAAAQSADPTKNVVNVFGEFDGVRRVASVPRGNGAFQQHTFAEEGYDSDVATDPTGKWIVFTSTRNSDHPNIYLQRVDGLSVIQLTDDDADYAYPVFSPDGRQIAFCSTRGGNWDIYLMDVDGKNVVQVTNGPQQHVHPSFSPDGGRVVFSSLGGRSGQWELWTVDLTSGEKKMIGFGLFPSWSPDKTVDRIAFQRARQRGSRWFTLWTLDLVNDEARRITEVAESSNAAIVCPTWSPDGKRIAFATIVEPQTAKGAKPQGQQDIWTINWDGSGRHRLTDGVGLNLAPYWGPDNRVFFVSDRTGAECVWSVNTDETAKATPKVAEQPHTTDSVGSAE